MMRAALLPCLMATPVLGDTLPEGCFQSSYDLGHLAAHPDQGVEELTLWIGRDAEISDQDVFFWIAARMADQGQGARDGVVGQLMNEAGYCRATPPGCAPDGDGGSFDITHQNDTGIRIETSGMRLVGDGYDDGGYDNTGHVTGLNETIGGRTRYDLDRVDAAICEAVF